MPIKVCNLALGNAPEEVGAAERFGFIEKMTDGINPTEYSVAERCRLLKVSCQGYYRYLEEKESPDKRAGLLIAAAHKKMLEL